MINFIDLFVILVLIFSTVVSSLVLESFQYKKSFSQINEILSNCETTKSNKIKTLRNLHDYLEDKTDRQIMLDNFQFKHFQFKRKNINLYNILLIVIIPLNTYIVLKQGLPENVKAYLVFFTPSIITLMLLGVYFLTLELKHLSIEIECKKFREIYYVLENLVFLVTEFLSHCREFYPSKTLKRLRKSIEICASIFLKVFLLVLITLLIFWFLLYLCILIITTYINKDITIQLFNTLISFVSSHEIIELTNGMQFSLSTLFFTLAISGTVIFSINQIYLAQKQELENKLSMKLEDYIEWYDQNKLALDLSIIDSFDENKRNKFNDALTELRSKLSDSTIKNLKVPIKNYQNFIHLIIISYFMGIVTILFPINLMSFVFVCFCIASFTFIVLAYQIFCDYKS
jgi:hypothetical protein